MNDIDLDKIRKIALIRARANSPIEIEANVQEDEQLASMDEEYLPNKLSSKED